MADAEEAPDDGDSSLYFTDGYVVRRDAIVIAAHPQSLPDGIPSRVLFVFDGEWYCHDFENADVTSVTFRDGVCYLMGMNGVVHSCGRAGREFSLDSVRDSYLETLVPIEPHFGALFRIRAIAGDVYACGQSSQVYVLRGGGWQHMDAGLLAPGAATLEDIDGTAPDDIYAVGWKGAIRHFDGRKWSIIDSPTNQHFSNVRCVSREEVYLCGNSGSLFRGRGDTWEFIGDPEFHETFWGMAWFDKTLYLSHNLGLMQYDQRELVPIEVDIGRPLSCHRLHAADGELWSFGEAELLRFDGSAWGEVVCPENE
jgi:hypothetical protein